MNQTSTTQQQNQTSVAVVGNRETNAISQSCRIKVSRRHNNVSPPTEEMTSTPQKKRKLVSSAKTFRLVDFQIYDKNPKEVEDDGGSSGTGGESSGISSGDENGWGGGNGNHRPKKDDKSLYIQMFGVNEKGETCSIFVNNFKPFFYVKVGEKWTQQTVNGFLAELRRKIGQYFETSILSAELVEHHKLYGFSGGKKCKFVKLVFKNVSAMNKVKNLWYEYAPKDTTDEIGEKANERRKKPYVYPSGAGRGGIQLELYESNIPPLLRCFHIYGISPSGWVSIPTNRVTVPLLKTTTCNYEYMCRIEDITPLPLKETRVPYKICSFDIEASSSHGDFPVPKKTYKKLATNMVEFFEENKHFTEGKGQTTTISNGGDKFVIFSEPEKNNIKKQIKNIVLCAFGYKPHVEKIDLVYPKIKPTRDELLGLINIFVDCQINEGDDQNKSDELKELLTIDVMFDRIKETAGAGAEGGGDDDNEEATEECEPDTSTSKYTYKKTNKPATTATATNETIVDVFIQPKYKREEKIQTLNEKMTQIFPKLEGDKTTFIGSTFMKYGEPEPYLNHCIVLGSCDPVEGAVIETVETERQLLLDWAKLIQRENPDIIIGYNIFGFDYEFMFRRAEENHCVKEFLKLSRRINEVSANEDKTGKVAIENSKIVLASGEYDLRFYKMTGRLQIDMLYYLRRDFNLASYKLDDVAGQYIGDDIKQVVIENPTDERMTLHSRNITGLHINDYIHIEITGFTTDYWRDGKKYKVLDIIKPTATTATATAENGNDGGITQIVVCGNEPELVGKKGIKWCVAKDDVSPQDIFRLTNGSATDRSIVAKYCIQDCNLVHHLMNKIDVFTGYVEMSNICSVPISFLVFRGQGIKLTSYVAKKCREKDTLMPDIDKSNDNDGYEGAIVLPPKCSMYMDNPVACVDYSSLYPSSMISQNLSHDSKVWTKEYDLNGRLIKETGEPEYDNMAGYQYIDIEFDTFKYMRNPEKPSAKAEKTKVGKMICRWAQFPNDKKGIMPSILEELLKARSDTRKMIKTEKDPFMQNILDKRQLGYKVTANSLYGQCGSKTSTFYEKDVAASTTATGRMMIIYAKKIIEEVYGDRLYNTASHGVVQTKAEYVYGDSVAKYTPVYVRSNGGFLDVCRIDQLAEKYGKTNPIWKMCKEKGKETKEVCQLEGVETWTEKGWTPLQRIIRHHLAPHKSMVRVITGSGYVDTTDDHSLVKDDGSEITPNECKQGTLLLHSHLPTAPVAITTTPPYQETNVHSVEEARIMGYFFSSGVCCNYNQTFTKRRYWLLENLTLDMVEQYLQLCKMCYEEIEWFVIEQTYLHNVSRREPIHHLSRQMSFSTTEINAEKRYILFPKINNDTDYLKIQTLVKQYNITMYETFLPIKHKIIPLSILTATENVRISFWKGYCDGMKYRENEMAMTATPPTTDYIKLQPQYSQLASARLGAFMSSIRYNIVKIKDVSQHAVLSNEEYMGGRGGDGVCIQLTVSLYSINYQETNGILSINKIINNTTSLVSSVLPPIQSPRRDEHIKNEYVYDLTTENHHFSAGVGNMVVHNTDSVFFTFNLQDSKTGEKIRGKDALEITIEIAQDAAKLCSKWLKPPMELSYEKTLMPFILLSKKRYVGMLYEENPNKGKMKYMGLSIKRRDSCDYLKDTYGGILNILMDDQPPPEGTSGLEPEENPKDNLSRSVEFLDQSLTRLIDGNVPMDKLTITRSLRSDYKNPRQIAHKVLADRIAEREPGNRPKPGDRLKFVHFINKQNTNKKCLQGEKIELPEFIISNKLAIDYEFYITNQLMKPIIQLYSLAVEQMLEANKCKGSNHRTLQAFRKGMENLKKEYGDDLEGYMKMREKVCSKEAKQMLFDKYLNRIKNENNGFKFDMTHYFIKQGV